MVGLYQVVGQDAAGGIRRPELVPSDARFRRNLKVELDVKLQLIRVDVGQRDLADKRRSGRIRSSIRWV
ncbi:hypothetical protein A5757_18450 [Mycobacterium sp. 852013-51886_SCH5428379]|nr:hypothetical protein A5757_18450 [Mycobacterium sp. 852013-51886_SCH5428379]